MRYYVLAFVLLLVSAASFAYGAWVPGCFWLLAAAVTAKH